MMMTRAKEEALENKGYSLKTFGDDERAARKYAAEIKAAGGYATLGEYTTRIRGWHHFAVWYKK